MPFLCQAVDLIPGCDVDPWLDSTGAVGDQLVSQGVRTSFASQAWTDAMRSSRDAFGQIHDLNDHRVYLMPALSSFAVRKRWWRQIHGCDERPPVMASGPEPPDNSCTEASCRTGFNLSNPLHDFGWCPGDLDAEPRDVTLLAGVLPVLVHNLSSFDGLNWQAPWVTTADRRCWGENVFAGNAPWNNAWGVWTRCNADYRLARVNEDPAEIAAYEVPRAKIRNHVLEWFGRVAFAGNMPTPPNIQMDRLDSSSLPKNDIILWNRAWSFDANPQVPVPCGESTAVVTGPAGELLPDGVTARIHGASCPIVVELILREASSQLWLTFARMGRSGGDPDFTQFVFPIAAFELVLQWDFRVSFPAGAPPCTVSPSWDPDADPIPVTIGGDPCGENALSWSHVEWVYTDSAGNETLFDFPKHVNWRGELSPISTPKATPLNIKPYLDTEGGSIADQCCAIAWAIKITDGLVISPARADFSGELASVPIWKGSVKCDFDHFDIAECGSGP